MGIFKYTFSLLLILISLSSSYAQEDDIYIQEDDIYAPEEEKEPLEIIGIKFGINVGRFSDYLFKPERLSYEGSFDFNLSNKYFGVIEAGVSEIDLLKDNYNYISEGDFIKFGMDYNMLKKHPSDYLGIGVRLGRASFKHSATEILIESDHWPLYTNSVNSKSYKAYWLEVALGLKGELLKNIYFGWSAMVKVKFSGGKDSDFQPYDIPGFGKGASTINLGANYYIYYQIPLNRNQKKSIKNL